MQIEFQNAEAAAKHAQLCYGYDYHIALSQIHFYGSIQATIAVKLVNAANPDPIAYRNVRKAPALIAGYAR